MGRKLSVSQVPPDAHISARSQTSAEARQGVVPFVAQAEVKEEPAAALIVVEVWPVVVQVVAPAVQPCQYLVPEQAPSVHEFV